MYPLVSVDDLQRQLSHEHVVIFDCRFDLSLPDMGREAYREAHIPGSHYAHLEIDLSDMKRPLAGRHPLPSVHQFTAFLASKGVTADSTIVAYDDQRGAFASRLWWLCRYMGIHKVAILDGGFRAWQDAGGPVEAGTTPSVVTPDNLSLESRDAAIIDLETLARNLHNANLCLVDSRSRERYCGRQEPLDKAAGHIPGAVQKFWQDCTDDAGFWHQASWHRERWRFCSTRPKVVYCGSGVTACVNLLSLDIAGQFDEARLYPGSWSEWCAWHLLQQHPERTWLATC